MWFLLSYLIFSTPQSYAENAKGVVDAIGNEVEAQREAVSDELIDISNKIDIYFSNTEYLTTRNATNLRVSNESDLVEGAGYHNNFNVALRLKLPRTSAKLQFELNQQIDQLQTATNSYTGLTSVERSQRESGPTKAGFSFYNRILDTDTRLTTGFDFKKHLLVPWTNLKLKNDIFLTNDKKHYIQLINDFYGETLNGTEHHALLTYNYEILKNLIFRQRNESRYRDLDHSFVVSQGVNLVQIIDYRNSMNYSYTAFFQNPATSHSYYLDRHVVDVTYRHRLSNKHYYVGFTPGAFMPKDKDWKVLLTFQFKIDIYFGNP